MPKKWEEFWSDVPIVNDGVILAPDSEEGKRLRNQAIQQIGNKTLLTGTLNTKLRNSAFMKKVNGELPKKPGYKNHASLLLTADIIEKAVADPKWDERHIEERTKELYDAFLVLWPSFSDKVQSTTSAASSEPDIDQFTDDQLSDAALLLETI